MTPNAPHHARAHLLRVGAGAVPAQTANETSARCTRDRVVADLAGHPRLSHGQVAAALESRDRRAA